MSNNLRKIRYDLKFKCTGIVNVSEGGLKKLLRLQYSILSLFKALNVLPEATCINDSEMSRSVHTLYVYTCGIRRTKRERQWSKMKIQRVRGVAKYNYAVPDKVDATYSSWLQMTLVRMVTFINWLSVHCRLIAPRYIIRFANTRSEECQEGNRDWWYSAISRKTGIHVRTANTSLSHLLLEHLNGGLLKWECLLLELCTYNKLIH